MKISELLERAQSLTNNEEDRHALFWLLIELLEYSNSDYYLNMDNNISDDFVNKYMLMVYKYLEEHIPVQQLIGHSYFYGNKFYVSKDTLIPRPETEELVNKTINFIKTKFTDLEHLNILDLATGSGCIGITLKQELSSNVAISDISRSALKIAKKNANFHNVEIDIIESNWFDNIHVKFDVIISNPPYIPISQPLEEKVLNEPLNALYSGDEGVESYGEILENIIGYLNDEFIVAFEHGIEQNKLLVNLIEKNLKDVKIVQEKDLSGKDRFTFIFK